MHNEGPATQDFLHAMEQRDIIDGKRETEEKARDDEDGKPNNKKRGDQDMERRYDASSSGIADASAPTAESLQNLFAVSDLDKRVGNEVLEKVPTSPKKAYLQRNESHDEHCRVCHEQTEEVLVELGCKCRGELAKVHRSCIDIWFRARGSNRCEICQEIAANIDPPQTLANPGYWVWRVDPASGLGGSEPRQQRNRGCISPLWVAFSIMISGLLLDVLISISLGVSALPVNIIIGVLVVLGVGTAFRLALDFCHEWSVRRVSRRPLSTINPGYTV